MTELLQSHDQTLTDEELRLNNAQRKCFLEEFTPSKVAVKILERTTKNFEYYINLVDKPVAGFEKIHLNFERITVGKMLLNIKHHMLQRSRS